MADELARFVERSSCITCGSSHLANLATGHFDEGPLRGFIQSDPWGESPMPYLAHQQWTLVRCSDCSTAFHQSILAPEWMDRCYTNWVTQEAMEAFLAEGRTPANLFNRARNRVAHVLRIENLTRNIRRGAAARVLDFGCGWGEFLSVCAQFGFQAYGVDFSPDRRAHGLVSIFSTLEDLRARLASDGKALHAITLFEVLEHVAEPVKILKELNPLVEVGGLLILETPDCSGVVDIRTEKDYRAIHPLMHINAFTPETLRRIAEQAGYRPVRRGVAQVATEFGRVLRTEAKRVLERIVKPTTQQYFVKV